MLNNILFRSMIIDLMNKEQKRGKRVYRGILDDFIYHLKKANSAEFDAFERSIVFEKYYPFLTEFNLDFIFSIETRNNDTNNNSYDLTSIKKSFSVFIKDIDYDQNDDKFIINMVPQCVYIFEKLKNEDLVGIDIFQKIKEVTSDLKIKRGSIPRIFYKWVCMVYHNRDNCKTERIYKFNSYVMNPIKDSGFVINIEIGNEIYSFEPGDFRFNFKSITNSIEIHPESLFTSRKNDIERYQTQGTLNESEASKYESLLKFEKCHTFISDLIEDVYKKETMFKQLICGDYQPIKNKDLDLKLDEINYFLSEFDIEINNFNEFEGVIEDLLAKNIIKAEDVKQFDPLFEKLRDESFINYLEEVM